MLGRILRVLIGFALASLAAAVTLVVFVFAPGEWASVRTEFNGERLTEAALFALIITPIVAIVALPALIGFIFAEVRKVGRWSFYALAGIATAAAGFVAQHLSEAPGDATILSNYAFVAFLTSGFIGGLAYWASSGRFAARGAGPAAPTAATTTAAARPTAAAPAGPTT